MESGVRAFQQAVGFDFPTYTGSLVFSMPLRNRQAIQAERSARASLRTATECLRGSAMLKSALGEDVVAHYVRCAEWEQEEFDRVVTDWEIARGFERA